jgi:hypothetical protein
MAPGPDIVAPLSQRHDAARDSRDRDADFFGQHGRGKAAGANQAENFLQPMFDL